MQHCMFDLGAGSGSRQVLCRTSGMEFWWIVHCGGLYPLSDQLVLKLMTAVYESLLHLQTAVVVKDCLNYEVFDGR